MVALTSAQQAAWSNALNILRNKERRTWILINRSSLGESFITCSLAKAFAEIHGGPVTMVMKESHNDIALMFKDDIFNIVHGSDDAIHAICDSIRGIGSFDIDQPIVVHTGWHGTGRGAVELVDLLAYPRRGGLTLLDHFRYMLRLGWDAPVQAPTIHGVWWEEAVAYARSIGMKPKQSAILVPDTNTNPPLPDEFWTKIAKALSDRGLKVFTNMAGTLYGPRKEPFPGTEPIKLMARTAAPLAELAGRVIGAPNGLMLLLLACKPEAEFTSVLLDPPPGQAITIDGYTVKNPIFWQTHLTSGLDLKPYYEYAVRPGEYPPALIDDIVSNNPATAYVPFPT